MKKLFAQLMKFGVVGFIAFLIDYGLLAFCTEILHINYLVSATIGFTVSVVFNYLASMRYVFTHKEEMSRRREFIIFVVLSIVGLVINNVDGLTLISADPKKPAEIVCEPRYAEVLNCVDCDNLTIEHVILGHTDGEGSCTGDVIALHDCWNTQIVGSELYGCGAYAFELDDCYSIDVKDCYIHDCTYGIATIDETYDVSFCHTRFEDCKEFTMFEVSDSGVVFLGCNFKNLDGELISADNDSTVKFAACTFDKDAKASLDEVAGDNIKVIE